MGKKYIPNISDKWKESIKNRGEKWANSQAEGKIDSALNPSRMKLLRLSRRKAQFEIAKLLNLKMTTYAQIERGKRPVDKKRADLISGFFKKPLDFLFYKESHKDRYFAIRINALTQKKILVENTETP